MTRWTNYKNAKEEKERLEKIINKTPNDAGSYYGLGMVCSFMNDDLKAEEYCEKAINIDSQCALYLAFLFYLNVNTNQAKAVNALTRFIELLSPCVYSAKGLPYELDWMNEKLVIEYATNLTKQGKNNIANIILRWVGK